MFLAKKWAIQSCWKSVLLITWHWKLFYYKVAAYKSKIIVITKESFTPSEITFLGEITNWWLFKRWSWPIFEENIFSEKEAQNTYAVLILNYAIRNKMSGCAKKEIIFCVLHQHFKVTFLHKVSKIKILKYLFNPL